MSTPPCLVAHADWSVTDRKRWTAVATPTGNGCRIRVARAGPVDTVLDRVRDEGAGGPVLFGVDAPIGLPVAYASRHAADRGSYLDFIRTIALDSPFFSVCDDIGQVCSARPFFPRTTGGSPRRHDQAAALGVAHHGDLLRRCDREAGAASLFWTLGPNQVGKAALSLWREVLSPALRGAEPPALWPFEGELHGLLRRRRVTIAETYPAEALGRLKPRWRGSKRRQADRAALADDIGRWLDRLHAEPDASLGADLADGFGAQPEAEDRFDCFVGLLGMLATLAQPGAGLAPPDATPWEGWILGLQDRRSHGIASF